MREEEAQAVIAIHAHRGFPWARADIQNPTASGNLCPHYLREFGPGWLIHGCARTRVRQRGDIGVEMDTDTRSVSCGGTVTRCTENLGVYLGVNLLGMRSRESQKEENRGDSLGSPTRHYPL